MFEQLKNLMFKGESAAVMEYLEVVNKDWHLQVSILDLQGRPAFGTQADPFLKGLSLQHQTSLVRGHNLIFYKPLFNEQRCHRCHNPLDRTRGAIITRHSMERVESEIRKTAWRILFLAIFLGFTSELFLLLVLRKWILKPLATLTQGAEILENGRLDHRIEIRSDDEVGALASCFNQMAESIEKSHAHLEQLMWELSAEKDFSDAIFNSTASGIGVLDRRGRLLRINKAGAEILGIAADKAVGMNISEIDPVLSKLAVVDRKLDNEVCMAADHGAGKPIGFSTSPLLDTERRETGTIVVFRDLTEIKKLEKELREKEHFDAMGKVVSGVAHEIRNPLFGISSIGQILERELASAPHKLLIQAMLKEAGRMRRLIDELLLYTRPARLDIKEIKLANLLAEMCHYAKAKNENIALSVNAPPLLTFMGDRDKIVQVFLNVLNNAIDAARRSISISADKTPGGMTEIKVTDDGAGIKKEDIGRVFDPFFTTKKGGTGLGLPICKKIIEDHEGTIDIQSSPADGTTVTLTFKD